MSLRRTLDWSQAELARSAGISQAYLSRIERGLHKRISSMTLDRLANSLGVSVDYLLDRQESKSDRRAVQYRHFAERIEKLRQEVLEIGNRHDIIRVPIFRSIPAGWPEQDDGEIIGYEYIPRSLVKSMNAFFLQVSGDSMLNANIEDGDLVLIDPGLDWQDGDVMALHFENGESVLRRVYKIDRELRLEAANPDYPTITVKSTNVFAYGVVIRICKTLK